MVRGEEYYIKRISEIAYVVNHDVDFSKQKDLVNRLDSQQELLKCLDELVCYANQEFTNQQPRELDLIIERAQYAINKARGYL